MVFAENRQLLQEAKLELKKSKRKDYYKVLGIAKDANEDAVKKAYRKHALLHHPGESHLCHLKFFRACLLHAFPVSNATFSSVHCNNYRDTVSTSHCVSAKSATQGLFQWNMETDRLR